MTTSPARINTMAIGSLVAAVVGVIGWRFVAGWVALLAVTIALVLGLLALGRSDRYGDRARWAAVFGVAIGTIFYAVLIVTIARDLIGPAEF